MEKVLIECRVTHFSVSVLLSIAKRFLVCNWANIIEEKVNNKVRSALVYTFIEFSPK